MKYEASVYQMTVENHTFWIAESKLLKGCIGQGDTSAEAIAELEENEEEWLYSAKKYNIPIPDQTAKVPLAHNGKYALRLSPDVYDEALNQSKELGVSLNTYFSNAIAKYNNEIRTYLRRPIATSSKIISFPFQNEPSPKSDVKIDVREEM